jgi:hypothetical protein
MKLFNDNTLKNMIYILLVFLFISIFKKYIFDGTVEQLSSLDNKVYSVRNGPDKQKKADLLAFLYLKLGILVDTLRNDSRYKSDSAVQRLISNWDKGISVKEIGNLESDAAYVINKQYMSFCLQDSPGGKSKNTNVEDTNLITYVGIHELAHVMSISIDHGSEFIKNFKFLLDYSSNITYTNPFTKVTEKLYIPLSELKTADNYCGVKIINSIN